MRKTTQTILPGEKELSPSNDPLHRGFRPPASPQSSSSPILSCGTSSPPMAAEERGANDKATPRQKEAGSRLPPCP